MICNATSQSKPVLAPSARWAELALQGREGPSGQGRPRRLHRSDMSTRSVAPPALPGAMLPESFIQ